MNQHPPAPKRPRSNSPNGHPDDSMGFQHMGGLAPMQEEAHSIMNSYDMKTKMEYDEFSMMSFNPLDEFNSYTQDPYMYPSHPLGDMNQPISTIAEHTPPMPHLAHFASQIPLNASEKMPMGVQLNPQSTLPMSMGGMGYNPHYPSYISMPGSVPMSSIGPPNGPSLGLPLHPGQMQQGPISSMNNLMKPNNNNINNPSLTHPTEQTSDVKSEINANKQRDQIHNLGTAVVCSPDSSSNANSQKALCTSSTTHLLPSQPNHSAMDSQLCQTHPGNNTLQNQLHYPIQHLKTVPEGSEISSLQSAPPQGLLESDDNRHRLLQQQLGILLHAHRCLKQGPSIDCKVPMCSTMKSVLKHMMMCETKENCPYAHCSSSRRIILHYKQCMDPNCKLCKPLKSGVNLRQGGPPTQPQPSLAALDSISFPPDNSPFSGAPKENINNSARFLLSSASLPPAANNLTAAIAIDTNNPQTNSPPGSMSHNSGLTHNWHQEVKQDLRQHLVKKLVMAIYPSANMQDTSVKNNRMTVLYTQAKRMEEMMFQQATSREEYYQMLAEKIYNIQKELDTRQKQRKRDYADPSGLSPYNPNYGAMSNTPIMGVRGPGYPVYGLPGMPAMHPPGMSRQDQTSHMMGDLLGQPPINRTLNMHPEFISMPQMHPSSWVPSPARHDQMGAPVCGSYPGMLSHPELDMELNKMTHGPQMGSPYLGGMPSSVPIDYNTCYNVIPPNKTITTKEAPVISSNYQHMPVQNLPPSNLSINMPPSSQPALINPSHTADPPTPGTMGHFTQQAAASSTTMPMPPQPSDSSANIKDNMQSEGALLPEDIKTEITSDNQNLEHTLEIKQGHISRQQTEGSLDMDTDNTVTTASASTTTLQDSSGQEKLHFEAQLAEKILSIKTEAELIESDAISVRSETIHTQLDIIKQEPMSVDSAPPNKGKDLSFKPSDSVTTPVSSSHCPVAPLGSAPARWSKPKRVYSQELLRSQLNPILTLLWSCEPDAEAFRDPVDTVTLGIPEYFSIVTYPMDLSTISQRLARGDYQCPWQFIDDIWLMFNNAWLFNRRNTKVYKSCTKLSEVYEQEIAPVIQDLGLCCGKKYDYSPQVLYCSSKNLCPINRDDHYWNYKDRFYYCQKCYSELEGDVVRLADDPNTAARKEEFKKCKNDYLEAEPFIDCKVCLRRFHQVCVLYLSPLFPNGFTCQNCLKSQPDVPLELTQRNSARQLPHYDISRFIEERVHELLRQKECNEDVFIRLVSTGEKSMELKHKMKERYSDNPTTFPYHTKALFAFEMIDNVEVCFYGMHVQEYGADCPEPNRKRVYISYLDSVFFFRPKQLRTDVYHEILISYLEYCKEQGYLYAHIWACPPSEGDDYIFHCHPVEQKTPKPKRLQEWYKAMLEKAIERRAVANYTDIYNYFLEHDSNPTTIPYFEGDFWPNIIEDFIKEIDHEEQERKQDEGRGSKKGGRGTKNKKNPTARKSKGKCAASNGGDELIQKISYCAEKHKESFFVIEIQEDCGISTFKETDYSVQCDLMEGRDPFLTLARERHLEFSSLRRVKYSTLALAYELHNQGHDKFIYTCNYCSRHVESRYHCNTCEDFDLCEECSKQNTHEHPLELWRGEGEEDGGNREANQQQSPEQILQRRIQTLLHTLQCKNQDLCRTRNCAFMKKLSRHATKHMQYKANACTYCHNFFTLILKHAKICMDAKCTVPFCARLKQKLSEQNRMKRQRGDIMYRRRMRNMNSPAVPSTPPKSVPPTSDTVQMDEPTTVTPNPPSVNSTKSPGPPIVPSLMESPAEQMTTQGPPPAGVEAEQQAKLIVAEAMSGNTDPSLYNEASPVTLQGQSGYRGNPMSMTRHSPLDQHRQNMIYNSPGSQVWDCNMSMSPMGPIGRGSPMHQGLMATKSPNSLPPQVRTILSQLNSPHQDQKHKAMEQAREDPDLLATIISMTRPYSRGVSPGMGGPADARNSPYTMNSMQPYIGSSAGVPMHGGMNRPMRAPSQSIMQTQGGLAPGSHQMNIIQSQMQMGMQRPQSMNRMAMPHSRNLCIGSPMPGYGMLGSRAPMAMGNSPFIPRHGTQLTRSTSMPGMVQSQSLQVPNSAMQMSMQMQDSFIPPGYPPGIDDMLIHPSASHGIPPDQEHYYSMHPGPGNNII